MDFETIRQVTADLTDEQLWKTIKISRGYRGSVFEARAIAALAREGWQPITTAPAPAAEGEAEAIAIKLQQLAPQNPLGVADPTIARAAELLRQQAPAPVASSERPWDRPGWSNEAGQCWMGNPGGNGFSPTWRLAKVNNYQAADLWQLSGFSWSLPHWAVPIFPTAPTEQEEA